MRNFTRGILAVAAALTMAGCGGGGGGTGGGTNNGDPLASGRAALNQVASGAVASDSTTLQGILKQFQQALQQKPDSADAHFGVALCLAGLAGNDLDGGFSPAFAGGTGGSGGGIGSSGTGVIGPGIASVAGPQTLQLPAPPNSGEVPPAPPGHTLPILPLPPPHHLSLLWNIDSGLANPYTLLNMLAPIGSLQYGLIPFYGYSQDSADVARRQKLLANLDAVVQNLQAVEANPDFSTTLPDPNRQGQTVAVGLPEVYLFDAYVNSLRAEVALSLAYVRDPGGVQLVPTPVPLNGGTGKMSPAIFAVGSGGSGPGSIGVIAPDPTTIFIALDKNKDNLLTPGEYLPASPYLTLRDASLLATAKQAIQAASDKETLGITGVLARPADAVFLVPNTDQVKAALTEVRDHVLPLLKAAISGPVEIELPHYTPLNSAVQSADPPPVPPGTNSGGVFSIQPPPAPGSGGPPAPPIFTPEKVTIDIAAWFAAAPPDLKAFAPTYTLGSNGLPDLTKTTYPDPTFGGLYPKGLPSDFIF